MKNKTFCAKFCEVGYYTKNLPKNPKKTFTAQFYCLKFPKIKTLYKYTQ